MDHGPRIKSQNVGRLSPHTWSMFTMLIRGACSKSIFTPNSPRFTHIELLLAQD